MKPGPIGREEAADLTGGQLDGMRAAMKPGPIGREEIDFWHAFHSAVKGPQ